MCSPASTSGSNTLTGCSNSSGPEHVFQWTPSSSGFWSIRTCGGSTNFDTIVYLLSESCPSGPIVGCNDDSPDCLGGSSGVASRIAPFVAAGVPYFIVVDGFNGQSGSFTLTVAPATACDFVTVIPDGAGGTFAGTTTNASPLMTGCNGNGPAQAFRFVPNASGLFEMRTCGNGTNFDTVVSVREGNCDDGPELACNDDACTNVFSEQKASIVLESLVAEQSYYVIVNGFSGGSGDFSLTVEPTD